MEFIISCLISRALPGSSKCLLVPSNSFSDDVGCTYRASTPLRTLVGDSNCLVVFTFLRRFRRTANAIATTISAMPTATPMTIVPISAFERLDGELDALHVVAAWELGGLDGGETIA